MNETKQALEAVVARIDAKLYPSGAASYNADEESLSACATFIAYHGPQLAQALEDARRYRFVAARGKLPLKTSQGYHYDYNVPCRTIDAAIDALTGDEA